MDAPPPQEDVRPFVHIAGLLHDAALNAPQVLEQDVAQGFLLLTDLGSRLYLNELNEARARGDAKRVDVSVGESGEILDVGRARRTIPSAILRALWLRDGGCRAPGCARRQHLHAHHVVHWADGGETKLSNLALLCPGHHRLVHEGLLRVELDAGTHLLLEASDGSEQASVVVVVDGDGAMTAEPMNEETTFEAALFAEIEASTTCEHCSFEAVRTTVEAEAAATFAVGNADAKPADNG